jgi:hypothetical protein
MALIIGKCFMYKRKHIPQMQIESVEQIADVPVRYHQLEPEYLTPRQRAPPNRWHPGNLNPPTSDILLTRTHQPLTSHST